MKMLSSNYINTNLDANQAIRGTLPRHHAAGGPGAPRAVGPPVDQVPLANVAAAGGHHSGDRGDWG